MEKDLTLIHWQCRAYYYQKKFGFFSSVPLALPSHPIYLFSIILCSFSWLSVGRSALWEKTKSWICLLSIYYVLGIVLNRQVLILPLFHPHFRHQLIPFGESCSAQFQNFTIVSAFLHFLLQPGQYKPAWYQLPFLHHHQCQAPWCSDSFSSLSQLPSPITSQEFLPIKSLCIKKNTGQQNLFPGALQPFLNWFSVFILVPAPAHFLHRTLNDLTDI